MKMFPSAKKNKFLRLVSLKKQALLIKICGYFRALQLIDSLFLHILYIMFIEDYVLKKGSLDIFCCRVSFHAQMSQISRFVP